MKSHIILSLLFLVVGSTSGVFAQKYIQVLSTISAGAGLSGSSSYTLTSITGEPTSGRDSSTSFRNGSGFFFETTGAKDYISVITHPVAYGWNMVSVPGTRTDYRKTEIFPTATTSAFLYEGSYVSRDTLQNGFGYWVKFSTAQNVSLSGAPRTRDSIPVNEGWNMIGSISLSIPVTGISSVPGGLITSPFYKYQGSYVASATIDPGAGYRVKVSAGGRLLLSSSAAPASSRIRIHASGELPPPPPGGSQHADGLPGDFALQQNYPNPFNPTTRIDYALPYDSHVQLEIFNPLGQRVELLKNAVETAGFKSMVWDASHLASGIYFYRLIATSTSGAADRFIQVRKMLIIK